MRILKDIIRVAFSNIVGFGTSFLVGFILPKVLTVADYGYYQQYIMYISVTYLFNLGYNDGIYIKYGGKNADQLDSKEVKSEHNFIVAFQILIFFVMLAVAVWKRDLIIAFFSLATLFDTLNTYHANFLQATGRFAVFSRGNILKSIFYILALLVAIFIARTDNYNVYILLNVLAFAFLTLYYEYHYAKDWGWSKDLSKKGKFEIFRVGFFILIANVSLTFVANIGRWVVKPRYPIEDFAQYSFQNSLLNVILQIVNAVGMVFYNVISKRSDQQLLNVIKQACIYLGMASGLAFFIFKMVIHAFLPNYIPSIELLSITFIAIPYIMLSKILIANLYKAKTSEMIYFRDSVLYLILSSLFVVGTDMVFGQMRMIAVATTVCYILWFLYTSQVKFDYLKNSGRELILLASHLLVFYLTANHLDTLTGLLAYSVYVLVVMVFSRQDLQNMIAVLKK